MSPGMNRHLHRAALILTCLLPVAFLHSRVAAEIGIALIDLAFLFTMARERQWHWLRQPWLVIALAWWLWETICSTPIPPLGLGASGWPGFIQALLLIRFIMLVAAMANWLLTTAAARRIAYLTLAFSALWIGLESWEQYLTGRNIFGDARWPDGSLTGPFWEPRAGAPYAHILCAAMLPAVIPLLNRPRRPARVFGIILAILGLATSVLIGQRMPSVLVLLALATACLFIPKLRPAAAIAVLAAAAVLAATPIISPPTYHKLVLHFISQMGRFEVSPYGELYVRAVTMALAAPWHGYGFLGFKDFCPGPQFGTGFPALGIAPTTLALAACNIHPHNFYLQALTDAGFPGLLLFAALNLAWLIALARGLWRNPDPLRVGLFVGVLTYAWPLASTDNFAVLPMIGWLIYMVGLGLAAAHITLKPIAPDTPNV